MNARSNGNGATKKVLRLELAIHLTPDDIDALRAFLLEEGEDADGGPAALIDGVLLWALETQNRDRDDA